MIDLDEWRWSVGEDIDDMLWSLHGKVSPRKLRLFACACCRRLWHRMNDEGCRVAVETVERFVDGQAIRREVDRAYAAAGKFLGGSPPQYYADWCRAEMAALNAAFRVGLDPASPSEMSDALGAASGAACNVTGRYSDKAECEAVVGLLRDVFGNPFIPLPDIDPSWLSWGDGTVVDLARRIYDERSSDLMPILGDALDDAGCRDAAILAHCREPGEHVKGCWLVDALLGKG